MEEMFVYLDSILIPREDGGIMCNSNATKEEEFIFACGGTRALISTKNAHLTNREIFEISSQYWKHYKKKHQQIFANVK
jgi:hypothetical protein